MIEFLQKYGWPMWFGLASSIFTPLTIFDWQWHVFFIPLIILVRINTDKEIKDKLNDKNNSSDV